jgi:hypothetical protein
VVSIGRGAHARQEPLSDVEWSEFRRLVGVLLTLTVDGTLHVDGALSTGEWKGVPEESATFVAEVPHASLSVVRAGLRYIGQGYGQECIALTLGYTEFV